MPNLAEEISTLNKKSLYKYRAKIYNEIAESLDKNNEIEAAVKAYQIAFKYADNVTLWCGAIDPDLNEHAYIVPGLGDAGDLAYGIKI